VKNFRASDIDRTISIMQDTTVKLRTLKLKAGAIRDAPKVHPVDPASLSGTPPIREASWRLNAFATYAAIDICTKNFSK